jgi:phosphate transport system permease protein
MRSLRETFRRGDPAIWFAGSGLGICLLMIGGMVTVIMMNGLGFFWPRPLVKVTLKDEVALGEQVAREQVPHSGQNGSDPAFRIQLKLGNRDISGLDFRWIDESDISARELPADAAYVERREYGPFIGTVTRIAAGERTLADTPDAVWRQLPALIDKAAADREELRAIERGDIGEINALIERVRLDERRLDLRLRQQPGENQAAAREALARRTEALQAEYAEVEARLAARREQASAVQVTLTSASGEEKTIPALDIFRAYRANQLSYLERVGVYGSRLWEFISGDPRESNTEGGILPAIFGTVMMVILMSLGAVPFGVLAALYLREYARQGPLVRLVRIAVNNLAGVPSIVFGVFGLGFFVYVVGGTIDQLFYPELLPTPTFGTGGILWASATLGLLTVPVVIVASEEAFAAVPRSVREASLATGATKFQTIMRVVLPAAAPGVLTGLILAMARAAGEVAPLMITGVVKLAPEAPLDGHFPFLHLERKFMHLGFHIYDVGFQSPNVEAAKPMVYATTLLLLLIVVMLNLTAIVVRTRLRKKYQTGAF